MSDDTQQRIEQLERDKRWWKRLAIGLAAALVLIPGGYWIYVEIRIRELQREAELQQKEMDLQQEESKLQRERIELLLPK
jgi:hypothetical protein